MGHGSISTAGRGPRPAAVQLQVQKTTAKRGGRLNAFLQYGSLARPAPRLRPVVIGALTCSALMMSAGAAQANHRMADGTLCPHAAGTDAVVGGAPQGTVRQSSTAPIGSSSASAPAAKPAAKPATKAPAQRPAAQSQAQKPATSQAQAQRPAAAAQPAVAAQKAESKATAPVAAPRQVPVAKPSVAQQPRAAASERTAVKRQSSRPVVKPAVAPEVTTDRRSVPVERPAAGAAMQVDSGGNSVPVAMLVGLLGLAGMIVAGLVAARLRIRRAERVASSNTFVESMDAAIEAELQEMIAETRVRAQRAPAGLGDESESDELELSQTH